MKKNNKIRFFLGLIFAGLFFSACVEEIADHKLSTDVLIDQSLIVPLAKVNFSALDLIEKDSAKFTSDDRGREIYLILHKEIEYRSPDTDILKNKSLLTTDKVLIAALSSGQTVDLNGDLVFGFNDELASKQISSIDFEKITIATKISLENAPGVKAEDISLELDFMDKFSQENGNTIKHQPTAFSVAEDLVLSKGMASFMDAANNPVGKLPLTIKVKSTKNLPVATKISLEMDIKEAEFNVIHITYKDGQVLGTQNVLFELPYPKEILTSHGSLITPKVKIKASSNLGVKLNSQLDSLKILNLEDATKKKFANFDGNRNHDIIVEKVALAEKGKIASTTLELDKQKGELEKMFIFDYIPGVLEYDFSYRVMASGSQPDYLLPNSSLNIDIMHLLPLYFSKGVAITVRDTAKLGIKDDSTASEIEFAEVYLVLDIHNNTPIRVALEISFLDENGNVVNTDIQKKIQIDPAKVFPFGDAREGEVKSSAPQTLKIRLTDKQWDTLKTVDRIVLDGIVDGKTTEGKDEPVHFTTDNFFSAKAGLYLKANSVKKLK